ncbi:MAG: hypothetical protein LBF15_02535 [Candidatus Peribacteria bacterium]|nr:hypothetical protein [Candidatus Peribacteria bacterium]
MLVNGVNLTINQGNNVRVSGVSYDVTGTSALVNNAFATLYVNGVAVNTQTIRNTGAQALRFTGFSQLVTSANPVRLDVRVSFTESFADGDQVQIQLSGMNAIDTVSSQAVNPGAYPSAATLTFRYAQ